MNPESYSLYYFTFDFNSNQSSSSSIVGSLGTNSINIYDFESIKQFLYICKGDQSFGLLKIASDSFDDSNNKIGEISHIIMKIS